MASPTTCGVCYSQFDDTERVPKVLDCGHSVCVSCLSALHRASHTNGSAYACPFCKKELDCHREYPTNFTVLELVESSRELKCCEDCHKEFDTLCYCAACYKDSKDKGIGLPVEVCLDCMIDRHQDHQIVKSREIHERRKRYVSQLCNQRVELETMKNSLLNVMHMLVDHRFKELHDQMDKFEQRVDRKLFDDEMEELVDESNDIQEQARHFAAQALYPLSSEWDSYAKMARDLVGSDSGPERRVMLSWLYAETFPSWLLHTDYQSAAHQHALLVEFIAHHILRTQDDEALSRLYHNVEMASRLVETALSYQPPLRTLFRLRKTQADYFAWAAEASTVGSAERQIYTDRAADSYRSLLRDIKKSGIDAYDETVLDVVVTFVFCLRVLVNDHKEADALCIESIAMLKNYDTRSRSLNSKQKQYVEQLKKWVNEAKTLSN